MECLLLHKPHSSCTSCLKHCLRFTTQPRHARTQFHFIQTVTSITRYTLHEATTHPTVQCTRQTRVHDSTSAPCTQEAQHADPTRQPQGHAYLLKSLAQSPCTPSVRSPSCNSPRITLSWPPIWAEFTPGCASCRMCFQSAGAMLLP